jgi:hydroxymethylbilane synthase
MKKIRLGTRGSPLALKQADMVRTALFEVAPDIETEIVVVKTSGDWSQEQGENRLLETAGGKGQFAKEIEEALLDGRIDAGVHSMKDMESNLPKGLVIEHMLPREDPRDCIVFKDLAKKVQNIRYLPENTVIGTSSVRRAAFLLRHQPFIKVVPLRGNVQTRIDKLKNGEQGMDGIMLAMAGLKRLGIGHEVCLAVETQDMLPSAGQGVIGIEILDNSQKMLSIFDQITCSDTLFCVKAERMALAVLDGTCHTPIGCHATLKDGMMHMRLQVSSLDGLSSSFVDETEPVSDVASAEAFGEKLGGWLLESMQPELRQLCRTQK